MFELFGVSSIDELKSSIAKCVPELSTGYNGCYWNARPILSYVKLDEIGSMN